MRVYRRIAGGGINGLGQLRRQEMFDAIRRCVDVIFGVAQAFQIAFVGAMAMHQLLRCLLP